MLSSRVYAAISLAAATALGLFMMAPSAQGAIKLPGSLRGLPTPVTDLTNVENILCGIVVWIFWGLIILSIVMFLVGGYYYVTSSGEPERVKTANRTLIYAAIAVVVALVAAGVPTIIDAFISGGPSFTGKACTPFGF